MGMKRLERIGNKLENDCFDFFNKMDEKDKEGNLNILHIRLRHRLGFIEWKKAKR